VTRAARPTLSRETAAKDTCPLPPVQRTARSTAILSTPIRVSRRRSCEPEHRRTRHPRRPQRSAGVGEFATAMLASSQPVIAFEPRRSNRAAGE